MTETIRLRPSTVLKFDECPSQYYFSEVEKLRSKATSANLPFGTAVHEAMTGYILATVSGKPFDPVAVFESYWDHAIENETLEFSSIWDEDSMRQTGKRLVEQFPEIWDNSGLSPLIDSKGPVVERRFETTIRPGVVLTGQPDVVAVNSDAEVIALDLKTTASEYDPIFLLASEQLTAYQVLLDAHSDELGIEGVDRLGFVELLKKKIPKTSRGTGPVIKAPHLVNARSTSMVRDYEEKVLNTAKDIASKRFPRRPRMAFNSPCSMCDFRSYCLQDSMEGLYRLNSKEKSESEVSSVSQ